MTAYWFIYSKDVVSGPFTTDKVESGLKANLWTHNCMIWWKGQKEWITITEWQRSLPQIIDTFKTRIQKSVWYVEHLGIQKGPMNSPDLQTYIMSTGILNSCRVWTVGMDRWMHVYEIPDLVEFFGVSRRKAARAPIKGQLIIKKNDAIIEGTAGSISVGGLGFRDLTGLLPGDHISLTLKSPLLVMPIHSQGKIVYTADQGFTGLQFNLLTAESESTISDYVKKFQTQSKILKAS